MIIKIICICIIDKRFAKLFWMTDCQFQQPQMQKTVKFCTFRA
jgi:hypothetical protein